MKSRGQNTPKKPLSPSKKGNIVLHEEPKDETFKEMMVRVKKELKDNSVENKENRRTTEDFKVYVIVALPVKNPANSDSHQELCHGLRRRLANKKNTLLVAPKLDASGEPPKALTLEELEKISGLHFPEKSTVLYLSGHANNFIFSTFNANELAEQVKEFLDDSSIKKIKLAGCNTASAYYPEDCENHPSQEQLINAYAKQFSQALVDVEVFDIEVYGYRGSLQDEQAKQRRKTDNTHVMHCYSSFYSGASESSVKTERASQVRVCYKNGELVEHPQFRDDMYENETTMEGEFRRITY